MTFFLRRKETGLRDFWLGFVCGIVTLFAFYIGLRFDQ